MKTFVIAEAGSNHNQNFEQAISLIDVAKGAGASACKFQTYTSETLFSKFTPPYAGHKDILQLFRDIQIPREWHKDLKQYCDEVGIEFMSTPFDERAVEELVNVGVKRLKIAGFESTDFRFVDMVASTKLPIIISLGIGFKIEYINDLLDIFAKHGNEVSLLHCNNAYPTPMNEIDLTKITELKNNFSSHKIGLSDHTTSTLTPALAVALGAEVIEKHFTLSRNLSGPDHSFAIEPNQLEQMIYFIKETERALVPQTQQISNSEKFEQRGRRSVVAKKSIKVGEVFTEENITTKRPFLDGNIPAIDFKKVLGNISEKNYEEDEFI